MGANTYVGVIDAAEYLGTSVRFIRRLIAERRIAFYRVGRHVRLSIADLEAFVQTGKVEPIVRRPWRGHYGRTA
jgi:excisionase family DNA binding protein